MLARRLFAIVLSFILLLSVFATPAIGFGEVYLQDIRLQYPTQENDEYGNPSYVDAFFGVDYIWSETQDGQIWIQLLNSDIPTHNVRVYAMVVTPETGTWEYAFVDSYGSDLLDLTSSEMFQQNYRLMNEDGEFYSIPIVLSQNPASGEDNFSMEPQQETEPYNAFYAERISDFAQITLSQAVLYASPYGSQVGTLWQGQVVVLSAYDDQPVVRDGDGRYWYHVMEVTAEGTQTGAYGYLMEGSINFITAEAYYSYVESLNTPPVTYQEMPAMETKYARVTGDNMLLSGVNGSFMASVSAGEVVEYLDTYLYDDETGNLWLMVTSQQGNGYIPAVSLIFMSSPQAQEYFESLLPAVENDPVTDNTEPQTNGQAASLPLAQSASYSEPEIVPNSPDPTPTLPADTTGYGVVIAEALYVYSQNNEPMHVLGSDTVFQITEVLTDQSGAQWYVVIYTIDGMEWVGYIPVSDETVYRMTDEEAEEYEKSIAKPTPTPEPTATVTPTPEPTATVTPTPEPTATVTVSPIPTATVTVSPIPTATVTPTPEPTATVTASPIPTATVAPSPTPKQTQAISTYMRVNTSYATMHVMPYSGSNTVQVLYQNDVVFINFSTPGSYDDNTWYYVNYYNLLTGTTISGYILGSAVNTMTAAQINEYVSNTIKGTATPSPAPTSPTSSYSGYGMVNTNAVNFRSSASTSGTRLAQLNQNTLVRVISQVTGSDGAVWYQCESNGITGYIRGDFLRLLSVSEYVAAVTSPSYTSNNGTVITPTSTANTSGLTSTTWATSNPTGGITFVTIPPMETADPNATASPDPNATADPNTTADPNATETPDPSATLPLLNTDDTVYPTDNSGGFSVSSLLIVLVVVLVLVAGCMYGYSIYNKSRRKQADAQAKRLAAANRKDPSKPDAKPAVRRPVPETQTPGAQTGKPGTPGTGGTGTQPATGTPGTQGRPGQPQSKPGTPGTTGNNGTPGATANNGATAQQNPYARPQSAQPRTQNVSSTMPRSQVDGKPVDGKPVDGKPVDGKPVDGRPVDGKPVDGKQANGVQQNQYAKPASEQTARPTQKGTQQAPAQGSAGQNPYAKPAPQQSSKTPDGTQLPVAPPPVTPDEEPTQHVRRRRRQTEDNGNGNNDS